MHWSNQILAFTERLRSICWCLLLALLPSSLAVAQSIEISNCYVTLLDEVELPAEVEGVILALGAKEGMEVKAGTGLGKIDDRQARATYEITKKELQASQVEADNDVSIRFARAQEDLSKAELQAAEETNKRRPGVVAPAEIRKLELNVTRSTLGIEQAKLEQTVLKYKVETNQAKLQLAKDEVLRRLIRSPLDGEIVEIYRRAGEWVKPGDAVLRIVRMDQLRVEGFVNINQHSRDQVGGRSVTVEVELGGSRTASFQGKITYVSPLIRAGGDYRVRAEVANKKQNAQWLLQPGQKATLTLGGPAIVKEPVALGEPAEAPSE